MEGDDLIWLILGAAFMYAFMYKSEPRPEHDANVIDWDDYDVVRTRDVPAVDTGMGQAVDYVLEAKREVYH
jgi:hypothetical protein